MINRTVLTGRLTRNPELRYTNSGTATVPFTLAVDRQFRNQNGDREADFINCVIWRKSAENFANFTHKGALVGVEGRVQTRNYENQRGERVYVTEVVVDNFALLEPKNSQNNPQQAPQGSYNQQSGNQPQQRQTASQALQNQNNGYQQQAPQNQNNGYRQQANNGQQGQPQYNQQNFDNLEDQMPF